MTNFHTDQIQQIVELILSINDPKHKRFLSDVEVNTHYEFTNHICTEIRIRIVEPRVIR